MKYFTKHLSRKIISLFLAGVLLLSSFSFFFGQYILQEYMNRHFAEVDQIVSLGSRNLVLNWLEDEAYEPIQYDIHLINYFESLVKEMGFYSIFLVSVHADYPEGTVVLRVKGDELTGDHESFAQEVYDLDPEEVEMAKGLRKNYTTTVEGPAGRLHAYFTAIPMAGGHSFLVGFYMMDSQYFTMVTRMAFQMYGAMGIGVLVLILLLSYGMRIMIVKRVKQISFRMKNYVENGEISEEKLTVKGNDEIAQMEEAFNQMTTEIREYIEQKNAYEDERRLVQAEMGIAASIQMGLLPSPHFENEVITADGYMKPARNVGGDFYMYHRLPDGKFMFSIGDVSGKGMSAAMFMSSITSVIRYNFRFDEDPARMLKTVNQFACEENQEQMFVTVFVGIYDPVSHWITYSSAGHNPPYLVGENVERLDKAQGMVLGIFDDEEYENASIQVEPGSTLLMYTDGVTEAVNVKKEFYTEAHLLEVLREASRQADLVDRSGVNPIHNKVLHSVSEFAGEANQADDITVLTVMFKPEPESIAVPTEMGQMKKLKEFILLQSKLSPALKKKIILAVEELFVNTVSYGLEKGQQGQVELEMHFEENNLTLVMKDNTKAFNPLENLLEIEDYDPDVQIGGLGRFIAFNIMDESRYEYKDGQNILTMTKKL